MPLFYIPKPRQFHYQPRFYDPEKERWEALKQKYADETGQKGATEADLEYFEQRVRNLEKPERSKLTWKDMFRKREMPKFEYKPRFSSDGHEPAPDVQEAPAARVQHYKDEHTKIKRRYDFSGQFERKQQSVWVKVAVAVVAVYLVYRYYGDIVAFLYNLVFQK